MNLLPGYSVNEDSTRVCCDDCKAWSTNGVLRHSSRCDLAPRATVRVSDCYVVEAKPVARSLAKAAKDGTLRLVASDDDIVGAVRCGAISESDAMNQDF